MKKSESYVDNVATVFIAFGVLSGLWYLLYIFLGQFFGFGSWASLGKFGPLDPLTRWVFTHFSIFYSLKFLIAIATLTAAIGLLKRKYWAYGLFLILLLILSAYHFLYGIFGVIDCFLYLPKRETYYYLGHPKMGYVFSISFIFWQIGILSFYAWLILSLRRKEIQKLF